MNRIVREHYPVAKLPEELREGFAPDADVRVVVEGGMKVSGSAKPGESLLDRVLALRSPPYRNEEEIDADLRSQRDDWDERG